MSASSTTPATAFRSPRRRSILRGWSRRTSATCISRTTGCSGPTRVFGWCAAPSATAPCRLTEIVAMLGEHHESLPAVLEPGALEARHVRLFTPDWWKGYAPKSAEALAACLHGRAAQPAARRGGLPHAMGARGRRGARGLRARHDPAERGEHAGARLDVTGGVAWTRN